MRISLRGVCTILLAVSVYSPVRAEDTPVAELAVTAGGRGPPPLSLSTPVTLVNRPQPGAGIRTVADLLSGQPGAWRQQTSPGQGALIVRGLKGSEVLHVVDGFRLNHGMFRNAPNQYLGLIDPQDVARVALIRGPQGSVYGADAMGGVLAVTTPDPLPGGWRGSRLAAGFAGADRSRTAHLAANLSSDIGAVRLSAGFRDADGLRIGGGSRLPFTGYTARHAAAKATFPIADKTAVTVQAQYGEQPKSPRHDVLVAGFGQSRPDAIEQDYAPQRRLFAQVRLSTADGEAQVGFQRVVDGRRSRDFGAASRDVERNVSDLIGGSLRWILEPEPGHERLFGAEIYADRIGSSRFRQSLGSGAEASIAPRFPDGSTMTWVSGFARDTIALDGASVSAGIRLSAYRIALKASAVAPGVLLRPKALTGDVGVVAPLGTGLVLAANLGEGFRPPNIFDLGALGVRGSRFNIPNPELKPERVRSADVALRWTGGGLETELVGFVARYDDKITQVITGATDPSGRLVVQARNGTRLTLSGLEARVSWSLTPDLIVSAASTYTRGEEHLAGQNFAADRIPPLAGELSMVWKAAPGLEAKATAGWAGAQRRLSPRDRIDPRINPAGTDGWTRLDLGVRYELTSGLIAEIGIRNLFDRRYREHGSGFDAPGRDAYLTIIRHFGAPNS
jgi:hemoglobin/transferrin/lactoferrin receptor protein